MNKPEVLDILLAGYRAFKRVCEGHAFTNEGVKITPRLGSWGQYSPNTCTTCIAGAYRWEQSQEFILNKAQDLAQRTSMQPSRALQSVLRDEEIILDAFRFPHYEDPRKDRIIRLNDGRTPLELLRSIGICLPRWEGVERYELTEREALERLRVILTYEGLLRPEPTEEVVNHLLLPGTPLDIARVDEELSMVMQTFKIPQKTSTVHAVYGLMDQLI
jgi:hypothetical protein